MITDEKTVRKLAEVVEIVATQECEAVATGQHPYPLRYDARIEWCLSCLTKDAMAEYLQ